MNVILLKNNKEKTITSCKTLHKAMDTIEHYVKHKLKEEHRYTRIIGPSEQNEIIIDYGSHVTFFKITDVTQFKLNEYFTKGNK